jgi:hypothetical protein
MTVQRNTIVNSDCFNILPQRDAGVTRYLAIPRRESQREERSKAPGLFHGRVNGLQRSP